MSDVDRLVDLITDKVRARLAAQSVAGPGLTTIKPRDRGDCTADDAPGADCASCGSCVVRRPWSVRAMEGAGAMRVGAPPGIGAVLQGLTTAEEVLLATADAS